MDGFSAGGERYELLSKKKPILHRVSLNDLDRKIGPFVCATRSRLMAVLHCRHRTVDNSTISPPTGYDPGQAWDSPLIFRAVNDLIIIPSLISLGYVILEDSGAVFWKCMWGLDNAHSLLYASFERV